MRLRALASRALALAVAVSLLSAATANHRATESENGRIAKVQALLANVAAMECLTHCRYCEPEPSTMHDNTPHTPGDDGGEIHSCAVSPNGCADHTCEIQDDNAELAALLPLLDGPAIRAIAAQNSHLFINADRRALQVIGCFDKVVVSVRATSTQAHDLFVD